MRHTNLAGAALAFACLGLSACGQEAAVSEDAGPEGFAGVSVTDGRLFLPAVDGNPGVLYFDIAYEGEAIAVLRAADVAGAESSVMHHFAEYNGRTQMSEMFPKQLISGETLKFEPGGYHVMALNLDESIAAGGNVEATLTFAGGDQHSFTAEVLAAGDER